ncbi:hypothetical protein Poli38472_010187 [Pythium oligandrum]|uniref:COR domain-containing protein n=1 Tax=Pythium oligandrum TaxID=41045 RepID=A0A8K1C9G9_PYTOL|nr:hypothetical protein Poli38472_010187 [Pythium oligandrum]|eukprot:TMW58628.1 hypothetical protein Poli38472_010187 [Pythium oligandrum]
MRQQSLHDAVKRGDIATVNRLLQDGVEIDALEPYIGRTALHYAAMKNEVEIAKTLLSRQASVHAKSVRNALTPLHFAADKDSRNAAVFLVENGADVNAPDKNGRTPLHSAASSDSSEVAKFLLENGAEVDAVNKLGETPLHYSATSNRGVVADVLLKKGASVNVKSKRGRTPLHEAAAQCRGRLVRLLLRNGADVTSLDEDGNSPLRCLAIRALGDNRVLDEELRMLYRLMSAGSPWTDEDDEEIRKQAREKKREKQVSAFLAAIRSWVKQRHDGMKKLTRLPLEVYKRGGPDVRVYFTFAVPHAIRRKTLEEEGKADGLSSESSRQLVDDASVYRKKLCVVGPTFSGKSGLLRAMTKQKRVTMRSSEDQDVGIEAFSWKFESSSSEDREKRQYEVTILDFAGRDDYQSIHSLFYSKHSVYAICIDLKEYADALEEAEVEVAASRSSQMDGFVEKHVFRWVRVICAREPESEFVFIGTKADLINHDAQLIEKISTDVMARVERKREQAAQELSRMVSTLRKSLKNDVEEESDMKTHQRILALEELQTKAVRFLSSELLVVSATSLHGLDKALTQLEQCIIESDTSFLIPEMYQKVEDFVLKQVQASTAEKTMTAQVKSAFQNITDLKEAIEKELTISGEESTAILHVLHDLGDIMWFDEVDGELAEVVFLNPALVIDFIRQVINRKLVDDPDKEGKEVEARLQSLYEAVRKEGRVAHELLCELDMWYDVHDDQRILQLKQLLFQFQLAYPAGNNTIEWNSDLIVPMYWKKRMTGDDTEETSSTDLAIALPESVCWEYDFHRHLPDNIFEKLGVQSYSSHYSSNRVFTRDSFETHAKGKYVARVAKKVRDESASDSGSEDWTILSIEVKAAKREEAWQQLVWYSMNLERLLEDYPGLWVNRYTLGREGKRYDVDQLMVELQQQKDLHLDDDVLPPSMEWYITEAWTGRDNDTSAISRGRAPTTFLVSDLEARFQTLLENQFQNVYEKIDKSTDKLTKQLAEVGNRRDYPSLWTLEYRPESDGTVSTASYIVKIRSHLSGVCYHEPIVVTVKTGFFDKYGIQIRNGISLLASVTLGDFLSPVVDGITNELETAAELHSLVQGLDLPSTGPLDMENDRTMSPDSSIVLLREILTAYDDKFDPLRMSSLCGLECAIIVESGEHIWVHRTEIEGRTDIIFRHDYTSSTAGVGDNVQQITAAGSFKAIPQIEGQPSSKIYEIPRIEAEPEAEAEAGWTIPPAEQIERLPSIHVKQSTTVIARQPSRQTSSVALKSAIPSGSSGSLKSIASQRSMGGCRSTLVTLDPLLSIRIIGLQDQNDGRPTTSVGSVCKWRLMDEQGRLGNSGSTQPLASEEAARGWSTQAFLVDVPNGVESLLGCTLVYRVQAKPRRSWTDWFCGCCRRTESEEIGMGSFTFGDSALADLESGRWYEYATTVLHGKGDLAGALVFHLRVETNGEADA